MEFGPGAHHRRGHRRRRGGPDRRWAGGARGAAAQLGRECESAGGDDSPRRGHPARGEHRPHTVEAARRRRPTGAGRFGRPPGSGGRRRHPRPTAHGRLRPVLDVPGRRERTGRQGRPGRRPGREGLRGLRGLRGRAAHCRRQQPDHDRGHVRRCAADGGRGPTQPFRVAAVAATTAGGQPATVYAGVSSTPPTARWPTRGKPC